MKTTSLTWLLSCVLILATFVPANAKQATVDDSTASNSNYKRSAVHVNIGVFNLVDDRFDYIYQQKSVGNIGISLETHMTDHFVGIMRFRAFEMENSAELFEFKRGIHAGAGFEVAWSELAISAGLRYMISNRFTALYLGTGLEYIRFTEKWELSAYLGDGDIVLGNEKTEQVMGFYLETGLRFFIGSHFDIDLGFRYHVAGYENDVDTGIELYDIGIDLSGLWIGLGLGFRF